MFFAAIAPGISVFGPVVRRFALRAVLKRLLEQAEAIAQAVAAQGNAAGHGAVQIAGGQAAETAVAQSGVLDLLEARKIHALAGEGVFHLIENAQIEQVVEHQSADQVFGREIKSFAFPQTVGAGFGPVVAHGEHHRAGQSVVQVLRGRFIQPFVLVVFEKGLGSVQYILRRIDHKNRVPFLSVITKSVIINNC